ncbi:MAG TPA: hypothetical protein VJ738_19585 [Steroidobacteraceae bacterium]|nr:hypothetical protein [Steroidobacteraceae bacterium]
MKRRLMLSLVLSSIVLVPAAFAATDAEMQACYQTHAQLMQKPSLRNLVTCWRVHGYLMER